MNILVVGSGGYIGRHLTSYLRTRDVHTVCCSSSDDSGIDPVTGLFPEHFEIPSGTDAVVYLAQSPQYRNGPDSAVHVWNVNVVSAIRAAVCSRRAGASRFIYASTGNVYMPSFEPLREDAPLRRGGLYALSKVHAEEALALQRSETMQVIVARIFGVYGPGQDGRLVPNLMKAIRNGEPVTIERNSGDASDADGLRISLCYVDDAVAALSRLASEGGPDCINIAGPRAVSIREIAGALAKYLQCELDIVASSSFRCGDLIADAAGMQQLCNHFTGLSEGLKKTVSAEISL